jgi:hypothetical protein
MPGQFSIRNLFKNAVNKRVTSNRYRVSHRLSSLPGSLPRRITSLNQCAIQCRFSLIHRKGESNRKPNRTGHILGS